MSSSIHIRNTLACLAVAASVTASAGTGDWPQWRGPNWNGSTVARNLPANLSRENIRWTTALPGKSGATPVVWGDQVFVTSPDSAKNLHLLCLDRKDGHVRWQKQVAVGDKDVGRNNMASPSPVTDGRRVYSLFGTGDLAAFTLDGQPVWNRNLGKDFGRFSIMWIYGASPALHNGRLIVQVLQRDDPSEYTHSLDNKPIRESFLLAIDAETGRDVWRQIRKTDSTKESQESYATPIVFQKGGMDMLAVVGGDHVSVHQFKDGAEQWRARLYEKRDDWYRIVTSPVIVDDLVIGSGPKGQPVVALKDGGQGNVTGERVAWSFIEAPTDWSTPLLMDGKLFVLDGGKKVLSRLNPRTGEKKWSGKIETDIIWSSPSGADGKIYFISEKGTLVSADAGDEFQVLGTLSLDDSPVKSSVTIAHDQLFVRTGKALYCIGAPR